MQWSKLQNGSDIRGVALETKEEQVNLTEPVVKSISIAFAKWLSEAVAKPTNTLKVSVGRDSRISGPKLQQLALEGLAAQGVHAVDVGLASTPCMFMSCVTEGMACDGAIVITASHLPFNRNGLKFFTNKGGLEKADIKKILRLAEEVYGSDQLTTKGKQEGKITQRAFLDEYAAQLVGIIRKHVNDSQNYEQPLKGFHIVVDAGNGAGGFFVDKVLNPLGADTTGSQFLEPDGHFPNHIPNPEDHEAIQAIIRATVDSKADLGIIFDTDVDRAAVVSNDGKEINRNRFIALMSAIVLREHPNTTIVTDSVTSSGLAEFISALGGKHHRFQRGYKNVINESIRLNQEGEDSQLAIETSGHGALKENFFLDDGAYQVVKVLIEMAALRKKGNGDVVTDLIKDLKEPEEATEVRLKFTIEEYRPLGERIISELQQAVESGKHNDWHLASSNYEGVRVETNMPSGWFLLRLSLHDPLLVLNAESAEPDGLKEILPRIRDLLAAYEAAGLDISKLE